MFLLGVFLLTRNALSKTGFLFARDLLPVLLAIPLIPSHIYTAKTDNPSQPSPTPTLLGSDNNIE